MKKLIFENRSGKSALSYNNNICNNKVLTLSGFDVVEVILDDGTEVYLDVDNCLHICASSK